MSVRYKGHIIAGGAGVSVSSGTSLPYGTIMLWYGTEDTIPDGWVYCNGENDTPDLRDIFVLGAGTKYGVGATGGSEEVTLTTEQMPRHSHTLSVSTQKTTANISGKFIIPTDGTATPLNSSYKGNSEPFSIMPPYHALIYIMYVGGGSSGSAGGSTPAQSYIFGHGLKTTDTTPITVEVNAVSDFEGDNTLPMTADGVKETLGSVETLLEAI